MLILLLACTPIGDPVGPKGTSTDSLTDDPPVDTVGDPGTGTTDSTSGSDTDTDPDTGPVADTDPDTDTDADPDTGPVADTGVPPVESAPIEDPPEDPIDSADSGTPDTGAPPAVVSACGITPIASSTPDPTPCVAGVAAWNERTGATDTTISGAVAAAAVGDTINVCPGTWTENLTISTELTLRGYGESQSVISGARGTVINARSALTIDGLAIMNGGASDGGGMSSSSDLTLIGVRFEANTAGYSGGAILYGGVGLLTVVDSCFVNNTSGYEGGAITADSTTDVQISGSWFGANWADYNGGAILYAGRSPGPGLDITTSTFDGNTTGYSGGAIQVGAWEFSTVTLEDSVLQNNSATYEGGAIDLGSWGGATVSLTRVELLSNSAGSGGAINLGGWGDQTGALNDCTVSGNTADYGAAFSLNNRGRADLIVDGGSVVSNVAARGDGGVSVDSDATVVVTSSDWGTGATDNLPDDVQGLTFGAGASFQCAGGICW